MKTPAHTPTPWEATNRSGLHGIYDIQIPGDASTYLAQHIGEANAAFIVRAVNSHQALVEALEMAKQCIIYCRRAHKDAQSGEGIPVELFIDAALKLAKEP